MEFDRISPSSGDNFASIIRHRLDTFIDGPIFMPFRYVNKLPFFLLGFVPCRSGWIENTIKRPTTVLALFGAQLAIGLAGRFAIVFAKQEVLPDILLVFRRPLVAISNPAPSLTYAFGLLLVTVLTYVVQFALTMLWLPRFQVSPLE